MSPLVFSYIDPEETRTIRRKRRFRIKIAALLLVPGLLLAGCQGRQWKEEDQAFSAYTEKYSARKWRPIRSVSTIHLRTRKSTVSGMFR